MVHTWIMLIVGILGVILTGVEIVKATKLTSEELAKKMNVKSLYMSYRVTYFIIFVAILVIGLLNILSIGI